MRISKCSKCQLGALNEQSFANRINSGANLIVTKDKISSDSSVIEKVVGLRMNKYFMKFAQNNKNRVNVNFIIGLDKTVNADAGV